MPLTPVSTPHAPSAIGPYSQGIVAGGLVFTAGQIALDPASGQVVDGGIREQTARVMKSLRAILEAAGSDMSRVIKTTVFLLDMADFGEMNAIYTEAFGDHKPARSTVAVAGLPRGVRVEIEAIGLRDRRIERLGLRIGGLRRMFNPPILQSLNPQSKGVERGWCLGRSSKPRRRRLRRLRWVRFPHAPVGSSSTL